MSSPDDTGELDPWADADRPRSSSSPPPLVSSSSNPGTASAAAGPALSSPSSTSPSTSSHSAPRRNTTTRPRSPSAPLSPSPSRLSGPSSPLSPLNPSPFESNIGVGVQRRRARAGTTIASPLAAGTATPPIRPQSGPVRSASHPLALDTVGASSALASPTTGCDPAYLTHLLSAGDSGISGSTSPSVAMSASTSAYGGSALHLAGSSSPLSLGMGRLRDALADADPDVSRPALRRVTSEAERAVAESQSQSRAESEGLSERSADTRIEVEVIVHLVKPSESLPGIALRYGIDLAVLRKSNKLWPSDPVHVRTKLYVPLDACRPSAASVAIVRGPDEGQVTIMPHRKKGMNGHSTNGTTTLHSRNGSELELEHGDHDLGAVLDGTVAVDLTPTLDACEFPADNANADEAIVLDLVRLPASQLRFFPRGKRRETARARASLDSEHGRSADGVRALSAIEAEMRKSGHLERDRERARAVSASLTYAPLGAEDAQAQAEAEAEAAATSPKRKSKPVRLRPPQAVKADTHTLAGRIQSLFSVPPPPSYPPPRRRPANPAATAASGQEEVGAGAGLVGPPKSIKAELLEMDARTPPPISSPRKTDKKRD